jgi:hypothetical protein
MAGGPLLRAESDEGAMFVERLAWAPAPQRETTSSCWE